MANVRRIPTVKGRVLQHADYLDRCGRQTLASDLRQLVQGLESIVTLADAQVSGGAQVAPAAFGLAARKFLEA